MTSPRHDAKFGDTFRIKDALDGLTVMVVGTKPLGDDYDYVTITLWPDHEDRDEMDFWALYRDQWDKIDD